MDGPEPVLGYAGARDGLRIAFTRHGQGPPLVFVRGWIGQLDIFWSDPEFRAFFQQLGRHFTVYRFDCRGNGLSSRETSDYSWPALVSDLEAVIEHESLDRFCLWGSTFGSVTAVRYAAQNPSKVSSLILDGTYARGWQITNRVRRILLLQALQRFPEMAILLLGHATSPAPHTAIYRRPEVVQQMVSPKTAAKLYGAAFKADVTKYLPRLKVPTLVLHRRNSQSIPFTLGRAAAALIPGAQFVALEGTAHNLWEEDAAGSLKAMLGFLGVKAEEPDSDDVADAPPDANAPLRKLVAVLYADVAGYTQKMERDEAGTHGRLLERLAVFRTFVSKHGGQVRHEAGDALMAEFASTTAAVTCAMAFQGKAGRLNKKSPEEHRIDFRIGVHLGDVISDQQTLYGTAINLAQRLESISLPGGVCVSGSVAEAVRQVLPYHFEFLGEKSLKHLSSSVGAYNVFEKDAAVALQDPLSERKVIGTILPR
jgi:class 3 adenylate cyclase